jgi:hypothetical protein
LFVCDCTVDDSLGIRIEFEPLALAVVLALVVGVAARLYIRGGGTLRAPLTGFLGIRNRTFFHTCKSLCCILSFSQL